MSKIEGIIKKLNTGNNTIFTELYGTNEKVLNDQFHRYAALINEFQNTFTSNNIELFSSPGRTEIGGNHTDHNHGRVLAGAVNLDNIAVAAKNNSNIIHIKSTGYPAFKVDINDLTIKKEEQYTSGALVKGIVARFKELGFEVGGFDMCNHSLVPKGSGLSSSASFEVLVGAVINHLFNNGRMDAVENAKVGQWAENNYFGKPCGLMDQTACSVGGLISIDFKDPDSPIVKEIDFDFTSTNYSLIITDVGGGHDDAA
jgi:galactokinase